MIKLREARITDGVPKIVAAQPWVQVLSEVYAELQGRVLDCLDAGVTFSEVDSCSEETLDQMAVWMAVVCLFGGVFIGALALVRLGYSVVVAKAAYKWICWAEENVIGSKMGEEKKKQVIKALRDLTPDWLDWAINEKFLDFFVELIFKVTKSKLEAYMEKKSKETATVARFGKAGEDKHND